MVSPAACARSVKQRAKALGFDTVGIAHLEPIPHRDALDRWLAAGLAGTMRYMHRQAERRAEPASIVPGARVAVVVTKNYYTPDPPRRDHALHGRVARYARGSDYHETLRAPLDELAGHIRSLGDDHTTTRVFVDAGPVPERELAQRAGLGWIGKNTMLLDPARGSYFFLGSVFTNLDITSDSAFVSDHCGTCTRCLDACPTDAFPAPYVLDATRCISYLTIEYRGEIEPALAERMGEWVFGCDICQEVCPWNVKFASPAADAALGMDPSLAFVNLAELSEMDDDTFERRFGWTPLERPGARGMRRNATIAQRNASREEPCPEP